MDSRDVIGLYEAYRSVYYENTEIYDWALELIEEGYDLDDYSDDDLIEAFISERKNSDSKGVAHKAGINEPDAWGPPTPFGQEATRKSLASGIRGARALQQKGVRINRHHKNKYLSHKVHQGWSHAAQNSENQTDAQKERRSKLINPDLNSFRTNLSKKERAKDLQFVNKAVAAARSKGKSVSEELDIYDLVLDHLLDEGFCDDVESAEVIMANMSEEWMDEIVEGFVSPYKTRPTYGNPQGTSPAMKALKKSDELQKTELGSARQKKQTRRSQQLNRMFQAARQGA